MAETIKKGVIKKRTDSSNTVILYPKTTIDQIEYESKTYTDLCGVANGTSPNNNTYANTSFYFITVKPTSWNAQ